MKRILLFIALFSVLYGKATHIVGGELIYQHLGGSSYYLTVKLYKDCNPDVADFPFDIEVEAFAGDGSDTLDYFILPRLGRDTLSPHVDTCAFNPGVCVEQAIYGGIVSLPPIPGGYHLSYQTYARNGSLLNVVDPLTAGESFYAYVPDNSIYLTNSSPIFSNSPPVFVCLDQDLDLDFSATDADGDSLAYSFYTPYNGRPLFHPAHYNNILYFPTIDLAGTPPDNITYPEITYPAGFSADNPLNAIGGDPLTISTTGIINGIPEAPGQYVVGVMVEEYRDGVKIGEIVRDFQFNVIDCPLPRNALIGDIDGCSGYVIDFANESGEGATDFWWDFGTGNPADTSILEEPTFDYTALAPGTFTVTLITEKGTTCADTNEYELIVSGTIADFEIPDTVCTYEPVIPINSSTSEINGTIDTWDWDFGDGTTSDLENPTHLYATPGDYTVRLIVTSDVGCTDTLERDIRVNEHPAAGIMPILGCVGLEVTFTNTSADEANAFHWDFGTGFPADTSNEVNPTFTYPDYGVYTVTLITQPGTYCADTIEYELMVSTIIADFTMPDTSCSNVFIPFEDLSTTINGDIFSWEWDFGDGSFSTDAVPEYGYTLEGDFTVTLVVISDIGCTDTISKDIHIDHAPMANIGTTDFCSGLTVDFVNDSDDNAEGFWWDFGTGNPADTSILAEPSFTYDSYGDYTVTLVAQKGTSCESSISIDITLSELVAFVDIPDTICIGSEIEFTDMSYTSDGSDITEWDWNFGDLYTSDLQNPTHTYTASGDVIVNFIVHSDIGCTDTLNHPLHVQALPVANAGLDTAVCLSDPSLTLDGIILNASSGIWTGEGGVFSPSDTDMDATYFPSLDELVAGETYLTLTTVGNGACEASIDSLRIRYLGDPEVDAGPDIEVCEDSIFVDLSATVGFETNVIWTTSGDGIFGTEDELATTYTFGPGDIAAEEVTVYINTFNFSGCPDDADTVLITFHDPPVISALNDTIICSGFPLYLDSHSSTEDGIWTTNGDGTFDPETGDASTYTHGPDDLANGSFKIFFETANNGGCPAVYDSLLVTVIPSPSPSFTAEEVCFGEATEFTSTSTSVDPLETFEWIMEVGSVVVEENPTYIFSEPGTHDVQLIVTSENGCKDTITQPVRSHYIPVTDFVVPFPCLNGGAVFADSTKVGDASIVGWNWDFGDDTENDTTQNPIHYYASEGSYDITLSVESEFGCTHDTTITIYINLGPSADFNVNPESANLYVDITFTDLSQPNEEPIASWEWQFGDGNSSFDQNTVHQFDFEGEYSVDLIVTDELGCSDTATKVVPIYHGPLVPSAFSPNGDQNNDLLMILGGNFSAIEFTVYNNWGEIVYKTEEVDAQGWDGNFKGEPQPLGVYVYVAKVTTFDGAEHVISGDVSLIR